MTDLKALQESERKWLNKIFPKILESGKVLENYKPENGKSTFKINDIDIKFISLEEAFMLTVCYRAKVDFEFNNKHKLTHIVVKKTPEIPKDVFDRLSFNALFGNEIHTYNEIIPAMENYTGEKLDGPHLLYSEINQYSASIVMDDFGERKWRLAKKRYDLSVEHTLKAIEHLGKFHGTTYAWKKEHPEQVQKLKAGLKEPRFNFETPLPEWVLSLHAGVNRNINNTRERFPHVDEQFLKDFTELLHGYYTFVKQFVQPQEPLATFCHGDYLRNNIAFKYDGEQPTEVLMFDLQTTRYTSPMIDLSTFLSMSTFASVRHTNFELIFNTYVDALTAQYTNLTKTQAPDFLSKENLLKEYTRYLPFSIAITVFFLITIIDGSNLDLCGTPTDVEVLDRAQNGGGEIYNQELSHQIREFYDLLQRQNLEFKDLFADSIKLIKANAK